MSSYRIVHREEPMIQGRVCHVLVCARLGDNDKVSETELVRIQGEGPLSPDNPTGSDIDITVSAVTRPMAAQPKA